MHKQRIVWTTLILAGLLAGAAYAGEKWSRDKKLPDAGTYMPPNLNDWNKEHVCDKASGVCIEGNRECFQRWLDNDGDGQPSGGDTVACLNRGNVGW